MRKSFFIRKRKPMKILKDLQGNSYKFYRGKCISNGCYFCSCFDVAASYRIDIKMPIIETEIAVRNPLVIDATTKNGHSAYGYLYIGDCKLYPEEKRGDLIRYIKKVGGSDTLSTDEVLEWAMETDDIDAVIVKNVREGIEDGLPIYDVMLWNEENLVNSRNVNGLESEYEIFRENTFKRVDLSKYISEKEKDGVVNITEGDGYFTEHTIQRGRNKWYMSHELIVYTDSPVEIYCKDTCDYITVEQEAPGQYVSTVGVTPKIKLIPYEDCIRVKGMVQGWKYEIKK